MPAISLLDAASAGLLDGSAHWRRMDMDCCSVGDHTIQDAFPGVRFRLQFDFKPNRDAHEDWYLEMASDPCLTPEHAREVIVSCLDFPLAFAALCLNKSLPQLLLEMPALMGGLVSAAEVLELGPVGF